MYYTVYPTIYPVVCQAGSLIQQGHLVLRIYGILHLFFSVPARLGNRAYRVCGEKRAVNQKTE